MTSQNEKDQVSILRDPKFLYIVVLVFFIWQVVFAALAFLVLRPSGTTGDRGTPGISDLAGILFGASSIALIILSLAAAGAAIVGWESLKKAVREGVEADLGKTLSRIDNETKGRFDSVFGHTLGRLSTKPTKWDPLDLERLKEAVEQCRLGYERLEEHDASVKLKFMALNNLVFYSSILGGAERAGFLLRKARLLRDAGQEHNSNNLLLTYCRAVLRFSSEQSELQEGRSIALALSKSDTLDSSQESEAKFYVDLFEEKIGSLPLGDVDCWSPRKTE